MADNQDSAAEIEAEKMAAPSTESSSVCSLPVPSVTDVLDLEKTTSKASKRTTQSTRSNRVATTAQDWDGADDPDNPLNWPIALKIYHTLIPALQCFTMYVEGDRCSVGARLTG